MRPKLAQLHQDLVVEVLVWLPVEALIKFRCVSKTWRTLIDSTQFRQLHLRRIRSLTSAEEQNKFLFGRSGYPRVRPQEQYYVAEFDSRDKMLKKPMLELHGPFDFKNENWRPIYGSCDGLLCLGYDHYSSNPVVILWNPYIKKYWKLPSHPLPWSRSDCGVCYGFGYDDIADDHKVVRRVQHFNDNYDPDVEHPEEPDILLGQEVTVFSLKSNCWTSLPPFPNSSLNYVSSNVNGILVNCALHWRLEDKLHGDAIWALDLTTHECHRISLPLETPAEIEGKKRLQALDGCLCYLDYKLKKPPFFHMWIMKDYGVQDSWTKLIVQLSTLEFKTPAIRPQWLILHPVAHRQGCTKLFFYGSQGVMWYDIGKGDWDSAFLGHDHPFRQECINLGGFQFIGSLIEPCPYGGFAASAQNTGLERVEATLFS